MSDLTDQQIDEMLQRVKRWSWPRQYGKSVIVDLVNAIPSLLAAKKEAVARAQKAEADADDLRRQLLAETYRPEGGEIVMRELGRAKAEKDRAYELARSMVATQDALAARLASAEAKLAAVRDQIAAHAMICRDESSEDDFAEDYRPELSLLCTCGWRAVDGVRAIYFDSLSAARAAFADHVVGAALAADTTPEPTSDLADVLGLTDEQREEHARQLAEAFARIRACER